MDARDEIVARHQPDDDTSWWGRDKADKALAEELETAGLLTADPGLEWYDANFRSPRRRYDAVKKAGFAKGVRSREWYKANAPDAAELLDALRAEGYLTAEPGRDWYADAFVKARDEAYTDAGKLSRSKLVEALIETGLLADCDAEWLGLKLRRSPSMLPALRTAGLLTKIADRDYFVDKFRLSRELLEALREAGLLTPECGRKWYRDAFSRTSADGGWRESTCGRGIEVRDDMYPGAYADRALFEAGLYPKEDPPSRRYLSAAHEGEALFDALVEHGHMNDHRGLTWYTARFKGDLLVRAMKASGLWDRAGPRWCVRHLTGAQQDQYCEEHGVRWRSEYMANNESSYRATTERPWSGRTSDGDSA